MNSQDIGGIFWRRMPQKEESPFGAEGGTLWFPAEANSVQLRLEARLRSEERFLSSRPGARKPCAGKSRVAVFGMTWVFFRSYGAAEAVTS